MERYDHLASRVQTLLNQSTKVFVNPMYHRADHAVPHLFGSFLSHLYEKETREELFGGALSQQDVQYILNTVVEKIREFGRQFNMEDEFLRYLTDYWAERKHKRKLDLLIGCNWNPVGDLDEKDKIPK